MSNTPILDNIITPHDLKKLDKEQLPDLCNELRNDTIDIVSKIGGHLGAGLGVIELTVALHYVFDTPQDKVIWDVGHQSYPHKILTGRRDKMLTLRKKGGLSGFTKRKESIYDPFGAGHSSTSISAALGFAVSSKLSGNSDKAIAVIGDGALSGGMAYEAINNAGHLKLNNLIIILNDNEMSISSPTGALSSYLARLISSSSYVSIKNIAKNILDHCPNILSNTVKSVKKRTKEMMNDTIHGNNLFEHLGVDYIGPIDGHNINDLVTILSNVRDINTDKPILLHVATKKGYGYSPAEKSDDKYHGVSKFEIATGKQHKSKVNDSYTKIFSDSLIKIAKKDKKIVAITAAMPSGTGIDEFATHFPDRCFDVGIAEQHAVTFAAGLACEGFKPFVTIYSTFLQRAYDQIIHDVAIQNLPVRFAIDRAGLVGADGPTHAGSFDIGYLSMLPNFVVMAPSDDQELVNSVYTASIHDSSPIAFRYPRGSGLGQKTKSPVKLEIGKSRTIKEGKKILILSLGTVLSNVENAAELFYKKHNFYPTIIDMRFAKPIDTKVIDRYIKNSDILITAEEGAIGGFSSQVNNYLNVKGYNQNLIIKNLFFPDCYTEHATPEEMYSEINFDTESISKMMERLYIELS